MKIAVSATQSDNLDANIDPRFGRCEYFIIIDSDTMNFESVPNASTNSVGGAGIGAAQLVINKGAEVVLTGNCGSNAFMTLESGGIKVILGVQGTIRKAVEAFLAGKLSSPAAAPNVLVHSGLSPVKNMRKGGGMRQRRP